MPERQTNRRDPNEREILEGFGARVKAMRERIGLPQTEFARKVGCSPGMVRRYERGQNFPKGPVLARFAEALHASYDYLLLGKKPAGLLDRRLLDLLKLVERLPPQRLAELISLVTAFLRVEPGAVPGRPEVGR
jgi:transcriptional regulator with XRE-family HTH domain